ncbi:tRNA threonylcarbamoyladenosine biosynthesis protein TsaB [Streptomyces abyssalis]|uniref:tRNA threonylcarbamoyladenosine biosynthesis protein TsaB n=1 Tax=Streptomyces abyssalis TaxID=933944 RepID=A0A1E7JFN4_9ACTN|nr:tRNA (adenosine(37)-N6)-threonylcarbamoyltransferase complex dimerization subunit type 1 TsaB [Streptomyces abyssalis]OEU85278.1 tRNA threonylcarbamoyladenosine biosynthesis protein TsaB [Streptomyces abyssalis]OEU91557.1 tRNA threonylcarbamoyladenosine biosynthesis protein TsaB [Streptomyces abyssalis]OEV30599.1 tRNA threonylcarbamoyladenosine biosynthesis protein TsaB [Streptomyces nanshensis]
MLLLALDTATPAITVALYDTDGDRLLAASDQTDARRHGELLLPSVDRVLREAGRPLRDVDRVVVGTGPGPYTGLRVGLATAESFGAALGIPVLGMCTLDGIAYASGLEVPFVVATDARRKEVYWARYSDARTRLGDPAVDRPGELPAEITALPAVGAGARLYEETFTGLRTDLPLDSSAAALACLAAERLAKGEEFPPPRPLYLRRPDARVPANYKVVTPR